jgi:hypothetical protein
MNTYHIVSDIKEYLLKINLRRKLQHRDVVDWLTPRLVLIAIIIFITFICCGGNSKGEHMSYSISITQGS